MDTTKSAKHSELTEQDVEDLKKIMVELRAYAARFDRHMSFILIADPEGYLQIKAMEADSIADRSYCHLDLFRKPFGEWRDGTDDFNAWLEHEGKLMEGRGVLQKAGA